MQDGSACFIERQCPKILWDAFHDAELLRIDYCEREGRLVIELQADIPNAPSGAASVIGLEFLGVREWRLWQGVPMLPRGKPNEEAVWDYLAFGRGELTAAIADDSPCYLSVAGVKWGEHVTFGFEIPFVNLPLHVATIIEADKLVVTADGHPSSLEQWQEWGKAGWERFGSS